MTTTLLVIHIIIAALMIIIILFQRNEGGGLGMGSGTMGGLMSSRGTANLLTRTTAVLATLFFISTLGLAMVFKGSSRAKSILDLPETVQIPQPKAITSDLPITPSTEQAPASSAPVLPQTPSK